ncbi:hypothetical protein EV356DRAFT_370573 [Viridothelium virens]|uniref:Uncharacterized protein n=1 Tax=Viridothelium virens TaxID=1048519 RepID=A0A6A6GWS5_VIRVR|nr:hypothetical protein EV356DRAFT_370573 [Viridothelium virens]
MPPSAPLVFNALIRTHHVTSRKKVAALKKAASRYGCHVMLRSGGSPGIMYVEGSKDGVEQWVASVQRLRYKDYQLIARPATVQRVQEAEHDLKIQVGLHEVPSVGQFGQSMLEKGLLPWWRRAMGFSGG